MAQSQNHSVSGESFTTSQVHGLDETQKAHPSLDLELSVVIPCLNEEKTVGVCVRKAMESFRRLGIQGEVVVVDNGSVDSSPQVAKHAGAVVVHHKVRGYGSALQRGFEEASGSFIIMGDADDTYDFSAIDPIIRLLRSGADLVMGNRFGGKIQPGAMPFLHRWLGTPVLTWHLNLFFNTNVADINCGLRGFRKEAVKKLDLKSSGMEFASEMVIKAAQRNLDIRQTPIDYYASSKERKAHLNTFRDGWRHLRFMLLFCPKYLFVIPGGVMTFLGLLLTVVLQLRKVYLFGMPLGLSAAAFAGALFFIGIQVMLFGLTSLVLTTQRGLLFEDKVTGILKKFFTLERGLMIGLSSLTAGVVMGIHALLAILTYAPNLPHVNVPLARYAITSVFIALIGFEIVFSSFYLSIFQADETLK